MKQKKTAFFYCCRCTRRVIRAFLKLEFFPFTTRMQWTQRRLVMCCNIRWPERQFEQRNWIFGKTRILWIFSNVSNKAKQNNIIFDAMRLVFSSLLLAAMFLLIVRFFFGSALQIDPKSTSTATISKHCDMSKRKSGRERNNYDVFAGSTTRSHSFSLFLSKYFIWFFASHSPCNVQVHTYIVRNQTTLAHCVVCKMRKTSVDHTHAH